jgi:GNAT superfamily N-acetyltransferase
MGLTFTESVAERRKRGELLTLCTRQESPALTKAACSIEDAAWHEPGFLNFNHAFYTYYDDLPDLFPDYHLVLMDETTGYPAAIGTCVPLRRPSELPAEGWEWIVETGATRRGLEADALGAVSIGVPAVHRGKGYGRLMIQAFLHLGAQKGLRSLLAPVRPSAKPLHPYVPIEQYIPWKDAQGRVYDPWLRCHLGLGGKLIGPCKRSMVVHEPVGFWETWAKYHFERSGEYVLDGALAPTVIDLERGQGLYEEPNIWVVYEI